MAAKSRIPMHSARAGRSDTDWSPEQIAVIEFNKMRPLLESFARSMTRKRLKVVAGTNTQTDGKAITIALPLELAKRTPHERSQCGLGDENGSPICKACGEREAVMASLYHEVAHIACDSFAKCSRPSIGLALSKITEEKYPGTPLAAKAAQLYRQRGVDDAQRIAMDISPYMRGLLLGTEDARVNLEVRKTRPGASGMIDRRGEAALRGEAMRASGEKFVDWSTQTPNAQFCVAVIAYATGQDTGLLDINVVRAVEALGEFVMAAALAPTVGDCLVHTTVLMAEAQRFGFFTDENNEPLLGPEGERESDDDAERADEPDAEAEEGSDTPAGGEHEPAGDGENPPADAGEEADSSDPAGDDEGDDTEPLDPDAAEDEGRGAPGDDSSGSEADEPGPAGPGAAGPEDGDDLGDLASDEADTPGEEASGNAEGVSMEPGADESRDELDSPLAGEGSDGTLEPGDQDGLDDGNRSTEASLVADVGGGEERMTPAEAARTWAPGSFGTPDEVDEAVEQFVGHDDEGDFESELDTNRKVASLVKEAIGLVEHMDQPSKALTRVNVSRAPKKSTHLTALVGSVDPSTMAASLTRLRRAFDDNKRSSHERNRRSGRVSTRVLGRRAWNDDDRLFTKKTIPGKRDYAVLIGVDVSGSTASDSYNVIKMLKASAYVQAELCAKIGVKFAIYAHTGGHSSLDIFEVKRFEDAWDSSARARLAGLTPQAANLDGHTMEFYRKRLEEVNATDKVLMYYTDGAMPLENYHEELDILKREIKKCSKLGIGLMSIGVGSSDPEEYGLDHVRIDSMREIVKVAEHLEKRLAAR